MNSLNCSSGWATDEIFIPVSGVAKCDASLVAFGIIGAALITAKWSVLYVHVTLWRSRQKWSKDRSNKLPIVPVLSLLSALIYTLFFTLTSTNYANSTNMAGPALYSMGFTTFAITSVLFYVKIVRLGKRLIPLSRVRHKSMAVLHDSDDSTSRANKSGSGGEMPAGMSTMMDAAAKTANFDTLGSVLLVAESAAAFAQFFAFFIVGVFIANDYRVNLVAFGVAGLFLLLHSSAILYQFERVVIAITKSAYQVKKANVQPQGFDLSIIIHRMRFQQFVISSIGFVSVVFYLLMATQVVPLAYYIVVIHMIFEVFASFSISKSLGARKKKATESNSNKDRRIDKEVSSTGTNKQIVPKPYGGKLTATSNEESSSIIIHKAGDPI